MKLHALTRRKGFPMSRLLVTAACVAVLSSAAPARAADGPPAGRWKFRLTEGDQTITFLFAFTEADGKWVGDFVASSARLQREPQFGSVTVAGDVVTFSLKFGDREFLSFDGVAAKDGKKITGSYSQFGGPLKLTELYPSKLKKLDDPVELARENLAQLDAGPDLFDAGFTVLGQAAAKKVPVEEVRGVADRLAKAAGGFGPRWERVIAVKLATTLADQAGFTDVALAQARRAERMLTDDSPTLVQMETFQTLNKVLTKAGKADEAKKYAAMVTKLEAKDFAEYEKAALGFAPEPYKGRKAKSDRTVLVELFTGAECPPCAAADLACDALAKAFTPKEVIVLQYHLHVPAPDPMTSQEGMERASGTYGELIRGAPTVIVNGKPVGRGGGPASAAKERYAEYRDAIEKALETPAAVKLAVTVAPGEKGLTAKAAVSDLEAPGEKVTLRFVVAEERIRFAGGNGIRYHHHVVRALPGGAKGFALSKKASDHTVTIDPADVLREKQVKYLDAFAKEEGEFPRPDRPLAFANLKLIAFVQNDATGEVLQAVQVDLK